MAYRTKVLPVLPSLLLLLAACGPATSPPPLPTTATALTPTATSRPTPTALPISTATSTPHRTPTPYRSPTPRLAALTPPADDLFPPSEYVVLLSIGIEGTRRLFYLTPAGNMKLVFPESLGTTCNNFLPPTKDNLILCVDLYGPGGLAVLDLVSGEVKKAPPIEGHLLSYTTLSRNGQWVAYLEETDPRGTLGPFRLRTWEVNTGTVHTISEEAGPEGPLPAFWSAATGKIYWFRGRPASEFCCAGFWGTNPDGSDRQELVPGDSWWSRLATSPDGRYVILLDYNPILGEPYDLRDMGGGINEARLLDLVAGNVRVIGQAPGSCALHHASWLSEDEIAIITACPEGENYRRDLFTVDRQGNKVRTLWSDEAANPTLWALAPWGGRWLLLGRVDSTWLRLDLSTGEAAPTPYAGSYWDTLWCRDKETLVYATQNEVFKLHVPTDQVSLLWRRWGIVDFFDIVACR